MGKIINNLLSFFMIMILILSALSLSAYAENAEADWRMIAETPRISFRDAQGELIYGLSDLWINAEGLSYDDSTVSYGEIKKLDYGSVDLKVSCVDYNYMIYGDGLNLPMEEVILAEMIFGKLSMEPKSIQCSISSRGYLQVDLTFEQIELFDDVNKEAEVYIQYRRKTINGDETTDFSKGKVGIVFDRVLLPDTPTDVTEDKPLQVEIILPESEHDSDSEKEIAAKKPYILIEECTIEDGWAAVTAGGRFAVQLVGTNLHPRLDVENLLMQVDAGNELRLLNPSNTFYIGNLDSKEGFGQVLEFQAPYSAEAGNQVVEIKFIYEYIDGDSRKEESITQQIVIPLQHASRFVVDDLNLQTQYEIKEMQTLYSGYANMGRGTLYNVTATLKSELFSEIKVLHLGNLSAGKGDVAQFRLMSEEEGTFPVEICYEYEDEAGQAFSKSVQAEITFTQIQEETVEKEEPIIQYITEFPTAAQEQSNVPVETLLLLVLCGAALVLVVFMLKKRE